MSGRRSPIVQGTTIPCGWCQQPVTLNTPKRLWRYRQRGVIYCGRRCAMRRYHACYAHE